VPDVIARNTRPPLVLQHPSLSRNILRKLAALALALAPLLTAHSTTAGTPSAATCPPATLSTNAYRVFLPFDDGVGVAVNHAGGANNAYAAPGNTAMWSTHKWASTTAQAHPTDGAILINPHAFDWSVESKNSFVIAFEIQANAPSVPIRIAGNSASFGNKGFAIAAKPSGKLALRISDGTTASIGNDSDRPALDGKPHVVVIALDASRMQHTIWVDKSLPVSAAIAANTRTTTSLQPFAWGNAGGTGASDTWPLKIRNLHFLNFQGSLPINFHVIKNALVNHIERPITTDLVANADYESDTSIARPVISAATPQTVALYRYLRTLGHRDTYVIGAHERFDAAGYAPNASGQVAAFKSMAGDAPGFLQWEYVDVNQPADVSASTGAQRQPLLVSAMKANFAAGGINMIHDHPGNPMTGQLERSMLPSGLGHAGNAWDTNKNALASIKYGGANNDSYRGYLDRFAQFCQAVGSPILYRPLHEPNGKWFWWGSGSKADYIQVWRETVSYLRDTKGLKNLLFVWNVNGADSPGRQTDNDKDPYASWYPGDTYVDVVSIDYYNNTAYSLTGTYHLARPVLIKGWRALRSIAAPGGKPLAFAELGYDSPNGAAVNYADVWSQVDNDMVAVYPDAAMLGLWRSGAGGPIPNSIGAPSLATAYAAGHMLTLTRLSNQKVYGR
jgi:beta-mannanase